MMNRKMTLARHAKGDLEPNIFKLVEEPVGKLNEGQILVRNAFASLEPGLAGAITGDEYLIKALEVGSDIPAFTVGTVVDSRSTLFKEGDAVHLHGGWKQYAVVDAEPPTPAQMHPFKLDLKQAPFETWLAMLGLSGFTAYIGMNLIAKPRQGETVVVSAAAGAVGGMAGQFAKLAGAQVVGVAGGKDKCDYVRNSLGFDDVVDYKTHSLESDFDQACPKGIDVYFENVGGEVLKAVWPRLNTYARVPLCGQVSQYSQSERAAGPNTLLMVWKMLAAHGWVYLTAKIPANDY